jgi:predicted nucleic-acid-binding Zn-ribbon protein
MSREIGPVQVQGRPLRCIICSHDVFWEHHLNLGNAVFSFLDPDSKAHCAVCARCGYVHMFLPRATIEDEAPAPAPAAPPAPA